MPIMMVFLFASVLLLAFLLLASTIHLLKSKHAHNTLSRSRSKGIAPHYSASGSSSCQTCHLCGGLRLRTTNALHGRRSENTVRGKSRTTGHWLAAMRAQTIPSIKQVVQKLISHHKRQAHVDFFSKLASLSNFSMRKAHPQSKDKLVEPAGSPTSDCSSDNSTGSSLGSSVDGTNVNAITGAARAEFNKVVAQDSERSSDVGSQGLQTHRVVLEILVSPSGNAKESTCTSSPGLTLKLETSATLEHLAGCVEALKSKDSKKCEQNADIAHISFQANDAVPKSLGLGCAHGDKASQRLHHILNEAVLSPQCDANSRDLVAAELEAAGREPMPDPLTYKKDYQVPMNLKDCARCGHTLGDSADRKSPKSDSSVARNCFAYDGGQPKSTSIDRLCGDAAADVAMESLLEAKAGSQMASAVPLNRLASLHIPFVKHKEQEQDADVKSLVGSPLASLNVRNKSIGGIGASSTKKEKLNSKLCALSDACCSPKSVFVWGSEAEVGHRGNSVKAEDHCPLQSSTDVPFKENFSLSSKKGKKKKKNRARKPKDNMDSLMADAKELQEIGKIALEAAKHVSAVPERELGCVCGALKGDVHAESCPYPFTSSGSMLQRKMREQYNQLVKSNAAKTLTLAQVGQFTSCLVEAKATLRQKSESIQRKFTIAKSLLSKADKSLFDRLCGQIYGFEMEQKKLEEDTVVYNRLQEQLKLSPAYQKMLEYGRAHFEVQPHTGQMIEKLEPEDLEMSFEEFLAQEKKDTFWQRHNLARSAVSAS